MASLWTRLREQAAALWVGLNRGQYAAALLVLVSAVAAVVLLAVSYRATDYAPLYTRLRADDAGEIVAALRERGIPYELADHGTSVLVPADRVYETRLDLAADGIPRRGVVGFEVFQDTPIGMTDFERMVRYQQALQGELVRTIRELREVVDARVHLTLPERSPFLREPRAASASVLLHLRSPLRPHQVRGIAHLVASSVDNLHPDHVTIIDSTGQVLNGGGTSSGALPGSDIQARLELQRAYERELELSVQSMLERVFGPGRAVAHVRAELNFDRVEERQELFEPVVRDRGVLRSQQRIEESFEGLPNVAEAAGVAGVEANIPGYVGAASTGRGERTEELSNFELNRTERLRIVAPGTVESLSVAVWVDAELGAADRQRIEDAVASALGLNFARGDRVTVEALAFDRPETVPVLAQDVHPPRGLGPWPWVALAAVALSVIFTVARRSRPAPARPRVEVTVGDDEPEPDPSRSLTPEQRTRRSRQELIEAMVREKPEEVAGLLRRWMLEDER